jgi:AcrR family transcriptional regulator
MILDAAETVVVRDGAGRMTLDAVASCAGISKATVLYDYKTKRELVRTLIERRCEREEQRIAQAVETTPDGPSRELRGRLVAARHGLPDDARAVAMNLSAVLAQDNDLRDLLARRYDAHFKAVLSDTNTPHAATVAFLALEGLKMLEWNNFLTFDRSRREVILADIEALIGSNRED